MKNNPTLIKPQEPVITKKKVYFFDTDCMNVVWHGNYLKFFEMGRADWLEKAGLNYAMLKENEVILALKSIFIEYQRSATLDDTLIIHTWMKKANKLKIDFYQEILKSESTNNKDESANLLASGKFEIACLHPQGYLKKIPEWILECYQGGT